MTNKQFLEPLIIIAWILSISILSALALAFSNYAPNPSAHLWTAGIAFVNVACAVYWMYSHLKAQGGK